MKKHMILKASLLATLATSLFIHPAMANPITNLNPIKPGVITDDSSTAISKPALSLGTNTIAIGNDTIAAGGNMSVDGLKAALAKNHQLRNEIKAIQGEMTALENSIAAKEKDIQDTIAARQGALDTVAQQDGIAKSIEAKENELNTLRSELTTKETELQRFRVSYEKEIQALEKKVDIVTNLGIDWSKYNIPEDGNWADSLDEFANALEAAIDPDGSLKAKIAQEGGPEVNHEFYKNYVNNNLTDRMLNPGRLRIWNRNDTDSEKIALLKELGVTDGVIKPSVTKYFDRNIYIEDVSLRPISSEIYSSDSTIRFEHRFIENNFTNPTVTSGITFENAAYKFLNVVKDRYSEDYHNLSDVNQMFTTKGVTYDNYKANLTETVNMIERSKEKFLGELEYNYNNHFFTEEEYKHHKISASIYYDAIKGVYSDNLKKYLQSITHFDPHSNKALKFKEEMAHIDKQVDFKNFSFASEEEFNNYIKYIEKNPHPGGDSRYNYYTLNISSWILDHSTKNRESKELLTKAFNDEIARLRSLERDLTTAITRYNTQIQEAERNKQALESSLDPAAKAKAEEALAELTKKRDELEALKKELEGKTAELSGKVETLKTEGNLTTGDKAIAIGYSVYSTGEAALAMGTETSVTGVNSVGLGNKNKVGGVRASVVGYGNTVDGTDSMAFGSSNTVTGNNSISVGVGNTVMGNGSGAFGDPNAIYGDNDFVLGDNNKIGIHSVPKNNVFIVGSGVDARNVENAVILGNESTAVTGKVSVGTQANPRVITFVHDGVISNTSLDAINGSQLHKLANADGNTINVAAWKNALGITNTPVAPAPDPLPARDNYSRSVTSKTLTITNGEPRQNAPLTEAEARNNPLTIELKDGSIEKKHLATALSNEITNKANADMDNVSENGKTVIRNLAKESIKMINGNHITVTEGTDGNAKTYTFNVASNGAVAANNTGLVTGGTVFTALGNKLDKNLGNFVSTDVDANGKRNLITALNNGASFTSPTGALVKDSDVKAYVEGKGYVTNDALTGKANADMDNVSENGKTAIRNLAKESIKMINGTNTTVTEGTDGNAKTYAVNVVGNGRITKNDKGLVTGGTVFEALKGIASQNNPLGISYTGTDKEEVHLDGRDGTRISNVKDGAIQPNSMDAVNGRQLFATHQAMQAMNRDISHVGAVSAALAGLHPEDFDPDYKFNIAAAYGKYDGANAYALGAFYRPNENIMFSVSGSITSGKNSYNAGISYKFGTSAKKQLANADAKRIQDMENSMKKLEELVDKLMKDNQKLTVLLDQRKGFSDVPKDHWANEAVEVLHGNDILDGYPDGEFKGDKKMTRYEYAQMLYKTAKKIQ